MPSRIGKNYFIKYLSEDETIKELAAQKKDPQLASQQEVRCENSNTPTLISEPSRPNPDTMPPFDNIDCEMLLVLLAKLVNLPPHNKCSPSRLKSFCLDDIVGTYQPHLKAFGTNPSDYKQLESLQKYLLKHSEEFRQMKFLNREYLDRLLNLLLDLKVTAMEASGGLKKKCFTQSRLDRLVFIWREIKVNGKKSLIDISNLLQTDLEKGMPFKVDKKTVVKLVTSLQELDLVVLTKFKIKIESQKIMDLITIFSRGIASDAFLNLSDEMIADDPSIQNPTFRRTNVLPITLRHLQTESEQGPSTNIANEKKTNILDQIMEGYVKQDKVLPENKLLLKNSSVLARFVKATELRILRRAMIRLQGDKTLEIISRACEHIPLTGSLTDRFLQNKFKIASDVNYITQMIWEKTEEATPLNSCKPPKPTNKYFEQDDLAMELYEKQRWGDRSREEPSGSLKASSRSPKQIDGLGLGSQKSIENTCAKLANILRKTPAIEEPELLHRFKNQDIVRQILRVLQLQGDLEKVQVIANHRTTTLYKLNK